MTPGPEAQTRHALIDPALTLAGWNVKDQAQVAQELELRLPTGDRQFVDYALKARNGEVLAVVEAKKTMVDARLGQEQGLQYAQNVQALYGGDLPYVFYTNGHDTLVGMLHIEPLSAESPKPS